MPVYANIGGTQKQLSAIYANVGGAQKQLSSLLANVGGVSQELMAQPISVGSPAILRSSFIGGGYTTILKDGPANASGYITTVKIYVVENMTELSIATFYNTGTNQFTARASKTIGSLTTGLKTVTVNLQVNAGDYIGLYWNQGYVSIDNANERPGSAYWETAGNNTTCVNKVFNYKNQGRTLSLIGTS